MTIRPVTFARYQQGIVLLVVFVVLFMVGASAFITVINNNVVDRRREEDNMEALRDAKDVLIAYTVSQADFYGAAGAGPGHLMCPDTDGDGVEDTPCGANSLGRLPISITLPSGQIFPVSDHNRGIDQQFWYAMSDAYRRNPAGIINSLSVANLTVDGQAGIAAVLIAPDELLTPQARPNNAVANYLEAANTASPDFVTNDPVTPATFNDRVLPITSAEIMSPVTARVAEAIKFQLDAYRVDRGRYPRRQRNFDNMFNGDTGGRRGRGAIAPMPAWFFNNNWDAISNYRRRGRNAGDVDFDGCNITFRITWGVIGVTKDQQQC